MIGQRQEASTLGGEEVGDGTRCCSRMRASVRYLVEEASERTVSLVDAVDRAAGQEAVAQEADDSRTQRKKASISGRTCCSRSACRSASGPDAQPDRRRRSRECIRPCKQRPRPRLCPHLLAHQGPAARCPAACPPAQARRRWGGSGRSPRHLGQCLDDRAEECCIEDASYDEDNSGQAELQKATTTHPPHERAEQRLEEATGVESPQGDPPIGAGSFFV